MLEATQTEPGDYAAWNRRWPEIGAGPNACLYTTGKPETPSQLYHREYWYDLWGMASDRMPCPTVELGAGRGTTSQYLAAHGCDVTLVDLSETGLNLAADNWRRYQMPQFNRVERSVIDNGLQNAYFDLVVSVGLLEHWEDPQPVLSESHRLLRADGLLWHVIVGETDSRKGHSDMIRTGHPAAQYAAWAESAGFRDVRCRKFAIEGVLILTGRK